MEGFAFEDKAESLSSRQLEFLSDVLEQRGYKNNKVQIEPLGKAGDNYVAEVKRITVYGDNGDTFKMVAKVAPKQEMARKMMDAEELFTNEITMYSEVLPTLVELQKAADVPEEELLRYPECYGVLTEIPHEIILLEDLHLSNFGMLDRFTPLTDESVRLVLKNFAILHSLSYALKKKRPEVFETYVTKFFDKFGSMADVPEFKDFLTALENDTIKILDSEKFKKAVRNSVSVMAENAAKILKNDLRSRYSVVIQGDAWTNNLMFLMEENTPVQAIMIDYQLSRVTCPVVDILYMIFNCTDHGTRMECYHDWIDYYHLELDKSLSNFGLKANYVYPRDQLDADLKRCSKIFFGTSIMLLTMLIRKPEDAAKVKEAMENAVDMDLTELKKHHTSSLDPHSVALFRKRVEDLVNSYRELGYIEN